MALGKDANEPLIIVQNRENVFGPIGDNVPRRFEGSLWTKTGELQVDHRINLCCALAARTVVAVSYRLESNRTPASFAAERIFAETPKAPVITTASTFAPMASAWISSRSPTKTITRSD